MILNLGFKNKLNAYLKKVMFNMYFQFWLFLILGKKQS